MIPRDWSQPPQPPLLCSLPPTPHTPQLRTPIISHEPNSSRMAQRSPRGQFSGHLPLTHRRCGNQLGEWGGAGVRSGREVEGTEKRVVEWAWRGMVRGGRGRVEEGVTYRGEGRGGGVTRGRWVWRRSPAVDEERKQRRNGGRRKERKK